MTSPLCNLIRAGSQLSPVLTTLICKCTVLPSVVFSSTACTILDTMAYLKGILILGIAVVAVQAAIETPQVPIPYAYHADQEAHESNETPGTYLQHYGNGPEGYKIQSGFEGYLVPAMATAYGLSHMNHGYAATALAHIQPLFTKLVEIVPKIGVALLTIVLLLATGTLLTSCICAFTPVCHMSFMGVNLTGESMRGLITQDRVAEVARFLQNSIKKYHEMNAKKSIEPGVESNEVK